MWILVPWWVVYEGEPGIQSQKAAPSDLGLQQLYPVSGGPLEVQRYKRHILDWTHAVGAKWEAMVA